MSRNDVIRDYALNQMGAPYVYGGTGRPCTPAYRSAQMRQYPAYAAMIRENCPVLRGEKATCAGCRHQGKRCFDCAQLTRRALETAGIVLPSGATSQWRSRLWAEKRAIDEGAARTVCVLFRGDGRTMQHTGLSLGDGRTVDARGHREGVVAGRIGDYPWTHYALLPGENATEGPTAEQRLAALEARVQKIEERLANA